MSEIRNEVRKSFFDRTDFKKTTIRKENFELLKEDVRAACTDNIQKIRNNQRTTKRKIMEIEQRMIHSCMENSQVIFDSEKSVKELHELNMELRLLNIQELVAIDIINKY